jgi:hypothetical protein
MCSNEHAKFYTCLRLSVCRHTKKGLKYLADLRWASVDWLHTRFLVKSVVISGRILNRSFGYCLTAC